MPEAAHAPPIDRAATRLDAWMAGYKPLPGIPDELIDKNGVPSAHWTLFLRSLAGMDPREVGRRFAAADRHIRDAGISHRVYGDDRETVWPLSHLPLLLGEAEWTEICKGVTQRATLLEAVLRDLYGDAKLVREGSLPAAVVTGSPDFLRPMVGIRPAGGQFLHLYAADLGRGPDGRWWILGDRTQAPSGTGYALENRLVLSRAFPAIYKSMNVERLAAFFSSFRAGLAHLAEREEPRICLMTPGPYSETYFEQAHLARYLGFLLVEGSDLIARDGRAFVRTIDGLKRADVLWRRVDADFIDPLELNSASRLGVPGLIETMRQKGVVVANAPGTGLIESRAMLSFLPALSREVLGEELMLPNIATWWCGQPREREMVTRDLDDLAIAGAFGRLRPGQPDRAVLGATLSAEERTAFREAMRLRPLDFVGQEVVRLSTTPVWEDGALKPRPFVLRVYAAQTENGWRIMPGGFCRISDEADARAVSMGEGARSADVWVLADEPVDHVSLMMGEGQVKVRRLTGHLPSRAADNLFWLGRYLERLEATLRITRSLCTSLMESDTPIDAAGETLKRLLKLLIASGAAPEDMLNVTAAQAASVVMTDEASPAAVPSLLNAIRRTASGMRDRFSADTARLLDRLRLALYKASEPRLPEGEVLNRAERGLEVLAALSGLAQENMNRVAGWRFLDMGRRVERGINTCRSLRLLGSRSATMSDLGILLDLIDSQITFRSRYLEGLAVIPVRDLAMLDPFNPRSVAFQIEALKGHLAALPSLRRDGLIEEPTKLLVRMAADIETKDAKELDSVSMLSVEHGLMQLSDAIGDRYFLQGSNARRSEKVSGLA